MHIEEPEESEHQSDKHELEHQALVRQEHLDKRESKQNGHGKEQQTWEPG